MTHEQARRLNVLTPDPDARRQLVKKRCVGPTHPTNLIRTEEEL